MDQSLHRAGAVFAQHELARRIRHRAQRESVVRLTIHVHIVCVDATLATHTATVDGVGEHLVVR